MARDAIRVQRAEAKYEFGKDIMAAERTQSAYSVLRQSFRSKSSGFPAGDAIRVQRAEAKCKSISYQTWVKKTQSAYSVLRQSNHRKPGRFQKWTQSVYSVLRGNAHHISPYKNSGRG